MYPKELNRAASDSAGYAVWVPVDRGYCPHIAWDDQKTCSIGQPGPHVPGGYTDATVPWEEGGQHGGTPKPDYRDNPIEVSEPGMASDAAALGDHAEATGQSVADGLAELGRLHDAGQLSDDEFAAAKRKTLEG